MTAEQMRRLPLGALLRLTLEDGGYYLYIVLGFTGNMITLTRLNHSLRNGNNLSWLLEERNLFTPISRIA